ncbi:MAG: hypothetical protein EA384_00285 [Spirochaetaceae bacterium]|nr:MAG: hypothetical protein EA384_00285 [Spirochaetaceae bacterium]
MHGLRIHGYVDRHYRDRDSGKDEQIEIIVIRCPIARRQGRQYTRRLLPEFLIPRCRIRLDHVAEASALGSEDRRTERVCWVLGCIDPRTAGRHLRCFEQAAGCVASELSARRAMSPELGDLPCQTPDSSVLSRLERLYRAEVEAHARLGGRAAVLPSLRYLLQAAMREKYLRPPSTSASARRRPP